MDQNKVYYEKKYQNTVAYKYKTNTRYQRYLIERAEKYMKLEDIRSVLDIGCGQGLNTALFLDDYPLAKITGMDLSQSGIDYANYHFGNNERITFECGNIMEYMIEDKFDLVTAFELLEHIDDWEQIANKMVDISRKYIMVSAPIGRMRQYELKHGHYRNFQKGQLETFFNSRGFSTLKTFYAGFPFWSPITRDLLNIFPGDSTKSQEHLGICGKAMSLLLYYSFRYLSMTQVGDQFLGLFKRDESI